MTDNAILIRSIVEITYELCFITGLISLWRYNTKKYKEAEHEQSEHGKGNA